MALKIDAKSLLLGVFIGFALILAVGAVHNPDNLVPSAACPEQGRRVEGNGQYQLTMAANETHVFYGRMHTGNGQIETWRYVTSAVPTVRDKEILLKAGLKSQAD